MMSLLPVALPLVVGAVLAPLVAARFVRSAKRSGASIKRIRVLGFSAEFFEPDENHSEDTTA